MVSHKLLGEVVTFGKGEFISGGIAALNLRLQAEMFSASGDIAFRFRSYRCAILKGCKPLAGG
jgi:hypothetical protein